jgi:hypothetical protein
MNERKIRAYSFSRPTKRETPLLNSDYENKRLKSIAETKAYNEHINQQICFNY